MSGMIDMCDWSERHLWLDLYVWKCQIQIRQINRLPYGRYISCMHTFIKQKKCWTTGKQIHYPCAKCTSTKHRQKGVVYEKRTPSTLQTDSRSPDASAAGRIIQPGNTNKVPSTWLFPLEGSSSWHQTLYSLSVC